MNDLVAQIREEARALASIADELETHRNDDDGFADEPFGQAVSETVAVAERLLIAVG